MTTGSQQGIDLVVALDVSGSMSQSLGRNQPTRLEAAKTVVRDFITTLDGDRVGLVIFQARALVLAPLAVGLLGAGCERTLLRRVQARGHTSELLLTFGLAYLIGEGAKLVWGLAPLPAPVPALFDGAPVTVSGLALPRYRLFMMGMSAAMLVALGGLPSPVERVRRPDRSGDVARSFADVSRLAALGFRPRHTLRDSLAAVLDYYCECVADCSSSAPTRSGPGTGERF